MFNPSPNPDRRRLLTLAAAGLAAPYAGLAHAQSSDYPNKPITLYVSFTPGGATDALMRALAEKVTKTLGQTVLIENRLGVAGVMGAAAVARAAPNGYTLSLMPETAFRLPYIQKTGFDPLTDFTYIIHLTGYSFNVAVRADAPWKQWSDLVADAKKRPGKITYGSTGVNGTMHLTMEEIGQKLGIEWVHVPYKGETEIITAMMGGHIDLACAAGGIVPFVETGKARVLVVWTANRSKRWPDVPTLRDVGLDMVANSPFGIVGPKDLSPQVVKTLHDAFKQALNEPSIGELLDQFNQEKAYLDTADYDRFARQHYKSQGELLKRLGVTMQP